MRVNAGTDHQSRTSFDPASNATGIYAPLCYIGFTANATAPGANDTTLAGELAAAGGGLTRGIAVYSHSNGTNTVVLSRSATINANDTTPGTSITLNKSAVFNAPAGGTMGYSSPIPSPPALVFTAPTGDSIVDAYTITV